ncbi:MAG: hypothetical protein BGN82_02175 [Alphaproteobacteria bacterium 65-7]|nr:MAG: hypothetical protein BGN82_02175 [Alphaproteobacteria bacterium 65-7]
MSFSAAISSCFRQYFTFTGRASRSELWYFVLFCLMLLIPAAFLGPIGIALALVLAPPGIALEVRRLHDTDRTGWWFWLNLIPILSLIKIVWFCQRGTVGPNRFGQDPLSDPSTLPASQSSALATSQVSMTERAEQLGKLKALLDAGTISQDEFERMKSQVLAS